MAHFTIAQPLAHAQALGRRGEMLVATGLYFTGGCMQVWNTGLCTARHYY